MRFSLFLIYALAALPASAKLVSHEQRLDVIRRARVREERDPSGLDLRNGEARLPKSGSELHCKYVEKDPLHPLHGHSPKFRCQPAEGPAYKVKYKPDQNHEVYGEVAGSRLLWALGFYTNDMASVKLVCENCPEDPWTTDTGPRATRTFDPVSVQRRPSGTEVSETEDEGWSFPELAYVDPAKGGSSQAETDALKLLAAFINHGDNTANQQRLLCPDADPKCEHPWMYVTDIGAVFGGKGYFTSFKHWSKRKELWKDKRQCVLDFSGTDSKFRDPRVGEAGRKLLAELMGKLTREQVKDLFLGARFDDLAKREPPVVDPDGKAHPMTVDDWAQAFMDRREQVLSARCPR